METEDIEKLKKDRDQLLSMLEKLNRLTADTEATNWPEVHRIFLEAESFKPKPFECWANVYHDDSCIGFANEKTTLKRADTKHVRSAVHLREVTPAPEWERWKVEEIGKSFAVSKGNGKLIATAPATNCKLIADAHNLEMQRVTERELK